MALIIALIILPFSDTAINGTILQAQINGTVWYETRVNKTKAYAISLVISNYFPNKRILKKKEHDL